MKKRSKVYSASATNKTHVRFSDSIKVLEPFLLEPNIILIDKKLKKNIDIITNKNKRAVIYCLEGSESTKSMSTLTKILNALFSNKKFEITRKTKLVVVGGGTLGDFGGFLAHILKRGLPLVMVPSTWLSAIDSAHGGKNGINFHDAKNQIGTIYPAAEVILIRDLLNQQPIDRKVEGFGELIKIAFIHSPRFFKKVASERLNTIDLFSYLSLAIEGKYKIVKQDPFETKGVRYLLNFGHTLAHAWEAKLGIHHGIAVLLGMYFDFLWALNRGEIVSREFNLFCKSEISNGVLSLFYRNALFGLKETELAKYLVADKKKENQIIRYVFPSGPSKLKIESVSVHDIQAEYKRQKKQFETHDYATNS